MMANAEFEEWCEMHIEEFEEQKAREARGEVEEEEEETTLQEQRRVTRSVPGRRERGGRGQEVRVSVRVWRHSGAVKEDPDDLTEELFNEQPPIASVEGALYEIGGEERTAPGAGVDDLDEWLQLPDAIPERYAPWSDALDAALVTMAEGEEILFETRQWRLQVALLAVLSERTVVDGTSAVATGHGGLHGFATTKRLGHIPEKVDDGPSLSDGCIVSGTVRVVRRPSKMPTPEAFGIEEWSDKKMEFHGRIGDGVLCEAFEAALTTSCRVGSIVRLAAAGECLLPDILASPGEDLDDDDSAALVVEIVVSTMDDDEKREAMSMTMDLKEVRALELKDRGGALFKAKRYRRAESVWHTGVKLFGFLKPEDSAFDPTDDHLKENERGRRAAIPLLLNEALLLRRRGALGEAKTNLNECLENNPDHVKSLFRRGQLLIDLEDWDNAKFDLQKCVDLGGPSPDVDKELKRLRSLERKQDAKDGKYFKHSFADDQASLYEDRPMDSKKMQQRRNELRERSQYLAEKKKKNKKEEPPKASVKREHKTPAWDWTASYSVKDRPKFVSGDDKAATPDNVRIDDLEAELDEISDEEEEIRRQAKQDYYNTQLGLGNMRIHAPDDDD